MVSADCEYKYCPDINCIIWNQLTEKKESFIMTTLKNVWSAIKGAAIKVWTTVKKNVDVVLMSFGF